MRLHTVRRLALPMCFGLALLAGCGRDRRDAVRPIDGQAPDFSLTDVNPNSATWSRVVSPRQHLGQISAWYFGHST